MPRNVLPKLDRPKEDHPGQSVAEDQQKEAHDNEEGLVHADGHCQHQHLQRGVLSGDGEEAENDHNEAN